jgi:hypothetical protein
MLLSHPCAHIPPTRPTSVKSICFASPCVLSEWPCLTRFPHQHSEFPECYFHEPCAVLRGVLQNRQAPPVSVSLHYLLSCRWVGCWTLLCSLLLSFFFSPFLNSPSVLSLCYLLIFLLLFLSLLFPIFVPPSIFSLVFANRLPSSYVCVWVYIYIYIYMEPW